ncbi:MAG: hypothetical protein JKY96_04555 [Phycisphaerales bacterium]|nr:hypothetical protein [Phycisphaerales bacterium]
MPLKRIESDAKELEGDGVVVLIDGDIILYQATFVCDVVNYHWPQHEPIHYKKDALTYGREHGLDPDDLIKTVTPEPIENCLHTIKHMIHSIMDACKADTARVFLTGSGNYREELATIAPYKGNRTQEKPTHFQAAKVYLIERFNAEVVDGIEADDALGYLQTDKTIIASLDKDLDQIKGQHYNWTKEELYNVLEDDADAFLYQQILTGDSTDNIKGIKGVGEKTARKLLEGCSNNYERYCACVDAYKDANQESWELVETAHLVYIQREEGVLWKVPTL